MFNAGHLLTAEEPPDEAVDQPEPAPLSLKRKPGRSFCHAASKLYIHDSGRCSDKTITSNTTYLTGKLSQTFFKWVKTTKLQNKRNQI